MLNLEDEESVVEKVDADVLQQLGHLFEMHLLLVDVVLGRVVLERRPAHLEPRIGHFLVSAVRLVHHLNYCGCRIVTY